jgi:hypothetical protein
MNTWQAWVAMDPAKILLHSVPPLVVVCAAEGLTDLRHRITEAVTKAVEGASDTAADTVPSTVPVVSAPVSSVVSDTIQNTATDTVGTVSSTVSEPESNTAGNTVQNTAPDTTEDTVADTAPPRPRKPARRRGKAPVSRNELARQIYDAHLDEHGSEPAVAEMMRQLKDAGHPTGNKTAASLIADIRRNPLRLAQAQ